MKNISTICPPKSRYRLKIKKSIENTMQFLLNLKYWLDLSMPFENWTQINRNFNTNLRLNGEVYRLGGRVQYLSCFYSLSYSTAVYTISVEIKSCVRNKFPVLDKPLSGGIARQCNILISELWSLVNLDCVWSINSARARLNPIWLNNKILKKFVE